jgi:hypothetical protein
MLLAADEAAHAQAACDQQLAAARQAATRVQLELSQTKLAYGEAAPLRWRAPAVGGDLPVFLAIETPPEVRFEGKNFIPFVKGQKPRFGLVGDGRNLAAVVPLHRFARDVPGSGEIGLKPYRAGSFQFRWSVVSSGPCGNHVLNAPQTLAATVGVGKPEVVVQDRFDVGKPIKRIRADSGRYDLLVYKDRYEVHDVATGARILRREGTDPNFSPTGRFVAALQRETGQFGGIGFDVLDLLSGTLVFEGRNGFLAWARDDSILLNGAGLYPGTTVVQTLADGRNFERLEGTKPPLALHAQTQVVLNLERGVVIHRYPEAHNGTVALDDLASGETLILGAPTGNQAVGNQVSLEVINAALENRFSGQLGKMPDAWAIGEPIKMSHAGYYADPSSFLGYTLDKIPAKAGLLGSWAGARFVRHREIKGETIANAGAAGALLGRALGGRALTAKSSSLAPSAGDVVRRLGDLGVAVEGGVLVKARHPPDDPNRAGKTDKRRQARFEAERTQWNQRLASRMSGLAGKFVNESYYDPYTPGKEDRSNFLNLKDVVDVWELHGGRGDTFLMREQHYEGSAVMSYGALWLAERNGGVTNISHLLSEEGKPGEFLSIGLHEKSKIVVRESGGGRLLFGSAQGLYAVVIDRSNWTRIGPLYSLPVGTLLTDLHLTADGRHLLQVNSDGSFHFHNIASNEVVLSGQLVDDEIVVYRSDGVFDSSYEGGHSVQVRFPGLPGLHGFNQFAALLKRPGLLHAVLDGRAIDAAPPLPGAPPEAALRIDGPPSDGRVKGVVEASSAQGLAAFRLYVDGRLMEERKVSGVNARAAFDLADPGSGRPIAAVAVDQHGLLSLPIGLRLPGQAGPKGRLLALLVGINRYDDAKIQSLRVAKSDAERLSQTMKTSLGGAYAETDAQLLTDSDATPEAILRALEMKVEAARPEDTLLFFFAGHGVDAKSNGFRLVTSGSRLDDLGGTSLASADLGALVARSKARVILLLDACQSGMAGSEFRASNDAIAGQLLTQSGAPVLVLAAAKGREFSIEDEAGGVFTSALIEIIGRERARYDRDRNGLLEAGEIYYGIKSLVTERSRRISAKSSKLAPHTPWLERNAMVGDFSLF